MALVFSFIGCAVSPMMMETESTLDENWRQISALPSSRSSFQSVLLPNNDVLIMGGQDNSGFLNDIWRSSDGGNSWQEITSSAPWSGRAGFQAVVLKNNDILVMSGYGNSGRLDDIWSSSDEGKSWRQIPVSDYWAKSDFQALVLNNGDLLVLGGDYGGEISPAVFLSKNGGTNWSLIALSNHWSAREEFQAVLLPNNDILVMGGRDGGGNVNNEVWLSKDGGTNWSVINTSAPWSGRSGFQSLVLNNGDLLVMSGYNVTYTSTAVTPHTTVLAIHRTFFSGIWLSSDNGTNWTLFTTADPLWNSRYFFQAMALPNNDVLVMGGFVYYPDNEFPRSSSEVWGRNF